MSVWETKTISNNVDFLYFDPKGNLVLFGKGESIIWATGIGLDAIKLKMQDNGKLVLYKDGPPIYMMQDGKLLLIHKGDSVIVRSTGTNNGCHSEKGLNFFCLFVLDNN